MRVLVVTPWLPTKSDTGYSFVERDIEMLARDHQVTVAHLSSNGEPTTSSIRYNPNVGGLTIPYNFSSPASILRAGQRIRALSVDHDIVHSMALHAAPAVWLAHSDRPWIHTEHYSGLVTKPSSLRQRLSLKVFKASLRFPDQVVVVGERLGQAIRPVRRSAPVQIPNFVRLRDEPLEDRPVVEGQNLRLIGVGNMIEQKGPDLFIEASSVLQADGRRVKATWVGDGPLMEQVKDLARKLQVNADFPGFVDPTELPSLLQDADVFLLPTASETFGVAIAEALGQGIPAVVTGTGEFQSFLPPRGSRLVKRNAQSIAEGVLDLQNDPNRMTSEEIRQYAVSRFSEDERAERYRSVYENALGTAPEPALNEQPVMVFHTPYPLQERPSAASALRPKKMRQAFEELGYQVMEVTGHAKQRKAAMRELLKRIDAGLQVEFVYSESATIPNSFTEPKHVPLHPFLDRYFFKEMKKRNIPVGVFYRDIYWAFPEYRQSVGPVLEFPMKALYRWDLNGYSRFIKTLFVPSQELADLIPGRLDCETRALPPAADFVDEPVAAFDDGRLHLLYVGGIGSHYDLSMVIKTLAGREDVELTLCVREAEWDAVPQDLRAVANGNINVVHRTGDELRPLYEQAQICLLYVKPVDYWNIAIPVKLYDYAGHCRPILGSKGTLVSQLISHEGIGWVLDYDSEALGEFVRSVLEDPSELQRKAEVAKEFGIRNTWAARAEQAAQVLTRS